MGITDEKIARINELYHKAKGEGLTEEEKVEQKKVKDEKNPKEKITKRKFRK